MSAGSGDGGQRGVDVGDGEQDLEVGAGVALIGAVLFLPALAGALLPDSWDGVLQVLPSNAAAAFTSVQATGDQVLGATAGALALAAWVVAILVAAVATTLRRDV